MQMKAADNVVAEENKQMKIDPLLRMRSLWPQATSDRSLSWRIMMIVRSAERVDRVFGPNWQRTEIPHADVFATDLNIEKDFLRLNPKVLYNNSPITALGRYRVQAIARAMHNRGVLPEVIYSSPALRSIQTSSAFANYFQIKIKIEPGLLEEGMSHVLEHIDEISEIYPIDKDYSSLVSSTSLTNETSSDSQRRLKTTIEKLSLIPRNSPLLIVSHASAQHSACELAHFRETPATTNLSNSNEELSDCEKSVQMLNHISINPIELGLRYPPESVVSLIQHGKVPYCDYRLMPNLIPPMTFGRSATTQPIISSPK